MSETINLADLFNQASNAGFGALPVGEYECKLVSAEVKKTGTGKHKITVRFQVTSGPYTNRSVFDDFVLSPSNNAALVIWFQRMEALGLSQSYFASNPPLEKVAQDLTGKQARLRLGIRTWENREKNEVLGIMPARQAESGGFPGASAPSLPPPPPLPSQAASGGYSGHPGHGGHSAPPLPAEPASPAFTPPPLPSVTQVPPPFTVAEPVTKHETVTENGSSASAKAKQEEEPASAHRHHAAPPPPPPSLPF